MNTAIRNRLKKLEGQLNSKSNDLRYNMDFIRALAERTEPYDMSIDEKIKKIINSPGPDFSIPVEERIKRMKHWVMEEAKK